MKRRLGLLDEDGAADPSIVLSRESRQRTPRPTIAIISPRGSVEAAAADAFIDALRAAIPGSSIVSVPASTPADRIDEALKAAFAEASGVLIARGEALPARMIADLLVAITFGRALSRQPPVFRRLLPEADLVLSEPRPGVVAEVARLISA